MLVLMQMPGESVYIKLPGGEIIRVMIGAVVGKKVRVCYEAPRHFEIDREKVYMRKHGLVEGNV